MVVLFNVVIDGCAAEKRGDSEIKALIKNVGG
jgi:hypothetical protein